MAKVTKCYVCENKLDKNAVGLNKKLLDKNLSRFFCLDCLASHLDVSVADLNAKINDFKEQGCTLFL